MFATLMGFIASAAPELHHATFYSHAIRVRPTEVHNELGVPIKLPPELSRVFANRSVGVTSFEVDVVSKEAVHGKVVERSVPLHEAYNHHFLTYIGDEEGIWNLYNLTAGAQCDKPNRELLSMKTFKAHHRGFSQFGGASGAEFRNNPHDFPDPYVVVLNSPTHVAMLLHVINIPNDAHAMQGGAARGPSPFLECPCTAQRKIDTAAGTIDGCLPQPQFRCSSELVAQRNPACTLASYSGGLRCCEQGMFLSDTDKHDVEHGPRKTLFLKMSLTFREFVPGRDRPLHPTTCCDATSDFYPKGSNLFSANIEYDIPKCPKGTPPERCVHIATSVEPIDLPEGADPDELIELVHAAGHMHVGGMHMDLIDDLTGQLVCRATPTYGTSDKAGDEAGYLVGIQPCVWGPAPLQPPPRFKRSHPVRTVAYYNSTTPHTGVMSLWLMSAAVVPPASAIA